MLTWPFLPRLLLLPFPLLFRLSLLLLLAILNVLSLLLAILHLLLFGLFSLLILIVVYLGVLCDHVYLALL